MVIGERRSKNVADGYSQNKMRAYAEAFKQIAENVVTFVYQNTDGANVENDSMVAVVYHRNFN